MKKVFAVCDELAFDPEKGAVWTISESPDDPGWETDSGYSGYGLTKEKAEFYVKCINDFIDSGKE